MTYRLSEEGFQDLQKRRLVRHSVAQKPSKGKPMYALGRLEKGKMNKTEEAYSSHLKQLMAAGEIAWFKFEAIKLRLADNTFYNADFFVMLASGELQVHEVKGFWTDDARVKIKVAASIYPFRFIAIKRGKNAESGWEVETF